MDFTYDSYSGLLDCLRENNYDFCNYHDYNNHPQCVILRHDIDNKIEFALRLAEVEASKNVSSTYFVLLTSDFYNVVSPKNRSALKSIQSLGHEIGLHYDETAYGLGQSPEFNIKKILNEAKILSEIIETPVSTVSMHRPSQRTLDADWQIPGMFNSYGKVFFRDFKFLSDSRRNWREPVIDIIKAGEYKRLHILTHAFWYHDSDEPMEKTVKDYITSANRERYFQMKANIRALEEILNENEV